MALAVNDRSVEVEELARDWPMLEALTAGTRKMRIGSTSYLPKWPGEDPGAYAARLATATLFPAYRRTVSVMSGKPFSKPITLKVPARIEQLTSDIDMQGCSLHVFAAEMFQEITGFGLAGILVEYPDTTPRDENGRRVEGPAVKRTVAQVEAAGLRPYWVRVRHNQILGWKTAVVGERVTLAQLRIAETYEVDDGGFGTEIREQVRVLEPGRWAVWRQADGARQEWVIHDSGTTSLREIPFVPLYGTRLGFMRGVAPMLDLAYLNVKHWQSQSDQDTILHVARVPILAMIGAEAETELTVGASTAVRLPLEADLKFVEHTGAAIEAGEASLDKLRDQMIQTGAELLVRRESGDVSATEASNDAEANKSDLQRIAENFEDALDQALWFTAQYAGLPDGGTVELFDDYGAATLSDASAQLIRDLQQGGLISKETAINELKRRGVLAESVDPATEADKVAEDGPAPGTLTDDGGEDQFQ